MSFIKCISNNKKRNLTIGKIYEVVCEVCDIETDEVIAYEFFNDKGSFTSLPVECVKVIDTIRIERLQFQNDLKTIGEWGIGKVSYIEKY